MDLSRQLEEAIGAKQEKAPVVAGQYIFIRTKGGADVTQGYVEWVDEERKLVRIRDIDSGTDIQYDIDSELYTIFIQPMDTPIADGPEQDSHFVGDHGPSVYGAAGQTKVTV